MRLNTETERFTSTSRYARVSVANFIATLFCSGFMNPVLQELVALV